MKILGDSTKRPQAAFLIGAFTILFAAGAAALEQALPGQIREAVERSALSQAEKTEVLDAAGRAFNAGIPADDVAIIVTRARDRQAGADATKALLKTVVEVQEKGLPTGPVLNRIQQGLSKGIPPRRFPRPPEGWRTNSPLRSPSSMTWSGAGWRRDLAGTGSMRSKPWPAPSNAPSRKTRSRAPERKSRNGRAPLSCSTRPCTP